MAVISIILVIDVQQGFRTEKTEGAIQNILQRIRASERERVFFMRFVNVEDSMFQRSLTWNAMASGDAIELIPEILAGMAEGDLSAANVFDKHGYSALTSQPFVQKLEELSPEVIELCGIDTDACVLATAFDLFDRGFTVSVLKDCCASNGEGDEHEAALKILSRNLKCLN